MPLLRVFLPRQRRWRWLAVEAPKLTLALIMLAVLLISSGVMFWGEEQVKAGRDGLARASLVITILLGVAFIVLSSFDYKQHLEKVKPTSDAYGSIFYTITTFHLAHLIVGLIMLAYVLVLPRLEHVDRPPHRPFHNASL